MSREEREKAYSDFQKENLNDPPFKWISFAVVDSLYSQVSWCLDSMDGGAGFKLFLEHILWTIDPQNVQGDITKTVSSFSEQGISLSFNVSDFSKTLKGAWYAQSPAGQLILLELERCSSLGSIGFTVF